MIVIGAGDSQCRIYSDSINLLFRGTVVLGDVSSVLSQMAWVQLAITGPAGVSFGHSGHVAAPLFLCDINRQNPNTQDAQFVNGVPWDRFHIRIWVVANLKSAPGNYHQIISGSVLVAAAHHEVLAFPGVHRVTAHESGKWRIVFDFLYASGWTVRPDAELTGNFNLVPFSNDKAAVISR